jgi:pyruvate formate lyase activating enzyme
VQAEQPDCVGIAFTYNEPVVGYEWVRDVVLQAPKQLAKVLVTNGFMNPKPWRELIQGLDALNIDVKAFREEFYQQQCGGSLAPILRNVETAISEAHVELTYLVVPGLNDSADEVRQFSAWLARVSPDVPVHFTRYFPNHRLQLAPTPLATLAKLRLVAQEELNFVYLGNVGQQPNTYCPRCEHLLIQRDGQSVSVVGMVAGHCERCGRLIPGVGI